jgi:hypothetical protein
MTPLKNVKILRRSPLIVTADALTETSDRCEYQPRNTRCLFNGTEHVIVAGMSRGDMKAGIKIGESMLMQLEPA